MKDATQRHQLAITPLPVVRYIGQHGPIAMGRGLLNADDHGTLWQMLQSGLRGHGPDFYDDREYVTYSVSAWRWLRTWSLAQLIEDGVVSGHVDEHIEGEEETMSESRLGMRTTLCAICGVEFFGYGQDARPVGALGRWVCTEARVEDGETIAPCAPSVLARRKRDIVKAALAAAKEDETETE